MHESLGHRNIADSASLFLFCFVLFSRKRRYNPEIKIKLHKLGIKKVVLLYDFCRQMFCELGPRGEGGYSEGEKIHVLGFKPIPKSNNSLQ